ncbi:MAG: hypothetical protein ABJA78_12085 [Ferruginibacter sp.]
MNENQQSLETLADIKRMMERSSRFISLSGLSGVSAGVCALAGAWFASQRINCWVNGHCELGRLMEQGGRPLLNNLFWIAAITFIAAFSTALLFTFLRSKKNGTSIWGRATMRLLWNTMIPLLAGGIFLLRMLELQQYDLVAPGCLIFYGLALVNASKYTLGEVRYLGYGQIIIGIINLWNYGYGLQLWALGFGVLHIIYGATMWWKYERKKNEQIN